MTARLNKVVRQFYICDMFMSTKNVPKLNYYVYIKYIASLYFAR